MSKRIVTTRSGKSWLSEYLFEFNDCFRVYGSKSYELTLYAVIIPDDVMFEGL